MQVISSVVEMKRARSSLEGSVGFVPTMGYLHKGHISLVQRAKKENKYAIASIFVNPTQFGPSEDLTTYPRDIPRDLALLGKARTDIVFTPSAEEIYPEGYCTWVEVEKVSRPLEGASRPGHFKGAATIVNKLFNIVQPHQAYFGQKDAQQLVVIKRMAQDLNMNLEVIGCTTVREADGLAMSSRNVYLNPVERKAASVLWKALSSADTLWKKGERTAEALRRAMLETIIKEPLARVDYVSVANVDTLEELEKMDGPCLVSLAVKIGKTRLIDNITLSYDK